MSEGTGPTTEENNKRRWPTNRQRGGEQRDMDTHWRGRPTSTR